MFDDRFSFPMQAALNLYTPRQTDDGQFPLYAPAPQPAKAPEKDPKGDPKASRAPENAPGDRSDEEKEGGDRAESAL